MAVNWPEALVRELAERRCILFLGAGVSASARSLDDTKSPPDWRTFLEQAANCMPDAAEAAQAKELIIKDKFLDAAQVIHDGLPAADFTLLMREQFVTPQFKPSRLHELVLQLDPKIIITTNFDEIYDHHCQRGPAVAGYNVCRYYQAQAVDALRSTQRLILKAHGCVSDPAKIVLTRRQYFDAKRTYPGFYAILDALFLTNTILFIGCGLENDPDIQLTLENANIAAPSAHPHYALVEDNKHPSIKRALIATHNIEFIEYPAGHHEQVIEGLELLREAVEAHRALYA